MRKNSLKCNLSPCPHQVNVTANGANTECEHNAAPAPNRLVSQSHKVTMTIMTIMATLRCVPCLLPVLAEHIREKILCQWSSLQAPF